MSLTAHFIDDDWELVSRCLKTEYHPESHTYDNLAEFITSGIHEFGLRLGNIVTVTTDSAANMIAAAKKAGKLSLLMQSNYCFIHISFKTKSISSHTKSIVTLISATDESC